VDAKAVDGPVKPLGFLSCEVTTVDNAGKVVALLQHSVELFLLVD
jgi:hypothetical protein